jgi:lipopolysaccharide export system protein LptA
MRLFMAVILGALLVTQAAYAADAAKADAVGQGGASQAIEVTADKSLEWYQEQKLYVARGKAKAVRGTMTVEADMLAAHERDKGVDKPKLAVTTKQSVGGGDIDRLTAEGNVHIYDQRQQVFGDKAIYDADKRVAQVTGQNLKYMTAKDVVTARDMMEYYQDQNIAVARGKAVALHDGRHVEGDVLTAAFTESKTRQMDLTKLTAEGNVLVLTANDVARGDKGVFDVHANVAVLTGDVRVTRADGTQLTGDVATVDFNSGESRMLNQGTGRVRALLGQKPVNETKADKKAKVSTP